MKGNVAVGLFADHAASDAEREELRALMERSGPHATINAKG
jgi:hypothetical protein